MCRGRGGGGDVSQFGEIEKKLCSVCTTHQVPYQLVSFDFLLFGSRLLSVSNSNLEMD